jgi:hypothetical protein
LRDDPVINRHQIIVHCGPPVPLPPAESAPATPPK